MKTIDFTDMDRPQLESLAMKQAMENEALRQELAYCKEQLKLKALKEYVKKSEQEDPNQLSFFDEAEATCEPEAEEPKVEKVCPTKRKKRKGKKDQIIRTLPKETVTYILTAEDALCPDCGKALHEMKVQIHRELEVIPAKFIVKEHRQQVYSCRNCETNGITVPIVSAPMPKPLLRNSLLSPSMGAYLCTRKYENRDPLHKIAQDFQRDGIQLSKQTLSNWVIALAQNYFTPVYQRMREYLLTEDLLQSDETPVQVLREIGRTPQTKSFMWLHRTGKDQIPIVLYAYSPSRKDEVPQAFLEGFSGYLQTDGYAGYGAVGKHPETAEVVSTVIRVGCLAHARRYYWEAKHALPKDSLHLEMVQKGIDYCNQLFDLDKEVKQLDMQERMAYKEEKIRPVFEAFFAWADRQAALPMPKGKVKAAITYTQNQKEFLENYLKDPRLEVSNNLAERSIRPFVLGRKNWLFCNTPKGAQSSAVIYSLMQTALANGLAPFPYLEYLLDQLRRVDLTDTSAIDALLPWSKHLPTQCFPTPEEEPDPSTLGS